MKSNSLIFIASFFLIYGCEPTPEIFEEEPSPYWGEAIAEKNGVPWEAEPYAFVNINHGNGLNFEMTVLDNAGLRRESISLYKVPFSPGIYPVVNTQIQVNDSLVGALFFFLDEDVLLGAYEILEADSSSFVTMISYDTVSKEVKGQFDLTFIAVHKPGPDAPDTLRLRNGSFHTKVIK